MILLGDKRIESLESKLEVSHEAGIDTDVLIDLCSINIEMYDPGIFSELLGITYNSVGESCSESNKKITLSNTEI